MKPSYVVVTPAGTSRMVRSYEKALEKACAWESDAKCQRIEICRNGKPIQWWTRNFVTGEWDFHGYFV